MRIAICDDESVCRARILDLADDYAAQRQDREVVFEVYESAAELLGAVRERGAFDICVLDIVMPEMNGIQLGQALRDLGCDSRIIYLTSSDEYAIDSFRIRAFHYLLKPVERTSFFTVLDEAIASIQIIKDKSFIVRTRDGDARMTYDSILYAELNSRTVKYHLKDGKTVESVTLRSTFIEAVQELLADSRFILCGAGLTVNLHHIVSVQGDEAVFEGGERVFLSKKACRELRTAWNDYWITGEG